MRRRNFIALSGVGIALCATAGAQPIARTWRIGYMSFGSAPADGRPPASLRDALRQLGYVEGSNTTFVARWAGARRDRLPAIAAEIVAERPDVIVAFTGRATEALKAQTSSIPIVFTNASDPVSTQLVASLSRPGANVTGITDQAVDLSPKRLDLLREMVPHAQRVAVLWNADNSEMTLRYAEIQKAARALNVALQPFGVREPEEFGNAFSAMQREHPDALLLVTDSLTTLNRKRVIDFASAQRIPVMYEYAFLVREGGLMSYGPDFDDLYRRAAVYVDRILKGAKTSELPVEQPTKYYLLINLKTAHTLGLPVPQSLLLRADEVVQP